SSLRGPAAGRDHRAPGGRLRPARVAARERRAAGRERSLPRRAAATGRALMAAGMAAGAIDRITIVGAGLIGASIALALRRALPTCRVVAVDPDRKVRAALVPGIADEATDDLAVGLRDAQRVFVACPPAATAGPVETGARTAPRG